MISKATKRLGVSLITFIAIVIVALTMSFSGVALAGDATANANVSAGAVGTGGNASAVGGNASANTGDASAAIGDINITMPESADQNVDVKFPEAKDMTTTNINAKGYRGFANPAETTFPGMPAYFGQPTRGPMFQDVKSILTYKDTFTLDELNRMAKDNVGLGLLGTKVVVTPLVNEINEVDRAGAIKVVMEKPEKATLKGYITVKATNDGKVSPEVLAEAMLAARALGANAVHVTGEGVERVMKAFGWGIGLAYTKATISNEESSGGVATGGTGISGGEAGYKDRPWIQLFAISIAE